MYSSSKQEKSMKIIRGVILCIHVIIVKRNLKMSPIYLLIVESTAAPNVFQSLELTNLILLNNLLLWIE